MVIPTDVQRPEPPGVADERATLIGFLEYHRQTLMMKCAGLTPEQLRRRPVPPSTMSLLGLVRHLADVERGWFRRGVAGENAPPIFWSEGNIDGDFDDVDAADPDEAFEVWRRECDRSREILDGVESLDVTFMRRQDTLSVRWLLTHLIEEYARHNGHADLFREIIDGATGE